MKNWFKNLLGGRKAATPPRKGKGIFVFNHTAEVIKAEKALKDAGLEVEVMGPPADLQSGCDMVLVFPLLLEATAARCLEACGVAPLQILKLDSGLLEPVSLFRQTRYGDYLMTRAANMKLTVHAPTELIVNVSGGGCPDVPYLASLLVGKRMPEADEPRTHGQTLCAFSLQKAFEHCRALLQDEDWRQLPDADAQAVSAPPETRPLVSSPQPGAPRRWLICGSIPDESFRLCQGSWSLHKSALSGCGRVLAAQRGTPALLAAALATCEVTGAPGPEALLTGDTGRGKGSAALYDELAQRLPNADWGGLTFHYLFPDVDGHNRVLLALEAMRQKPLLVADAGYMYVAKMSGHATSYDLFTPDMGELAFLADEHAPHPFYTRGFLLAEESDAHTLMERAFAHEDSAAWMLIKGEHDLLAHAGQVRAAVGSPLIPNMEPIGGTGDLLTGMVTGLLASGYAMETACVAAARANREAGALARPHPGTPVAELLPFLPKALEKSLKEL